MDDHGNDLANATGPLTLLTGQTGEIEYAGDVDYFSANLSGGVRYRVTTSMLGAGADTVVTIFDTNGTTQLFQNDDAPAGGPQSLIDFDIVTTGLYGIQVSDANAAATTGTYTVTYSIAPPPPPPAAANECAMATAINSPQALQLDSSAATTNVTDPAPSCRILGADPGSASVWFAHTAAASQMLTADSNDTTYDTILGVYTGACGALTEIACDDDGGTGLQSLTSFSATTGTAYTFYVANWDTTGSGGTVTFRLYPQGSTPPTPGPPPPPAPPPAPVILGLPLNGQVPTAGVEEFAIDLEAGETYTFQVDVDNPASDDTVLELRDARGALLAYNDDVNFAGAASPANELGSQISGFVPATSGTYTLVVSGHADQTPAFTLTATQGGTATPAGPRATRAVFLDVDRTNSLNEGDRIVVLFDAPVTLSVDDPAQVFELPLAGDSFGAGATVSVNGAHPERATIVLGAGAQLSLTGSFDKASDTGPSGLRVADVSPIAGAEGEPAVAATLDVDSSKAEAASPTPSW